MHTVLVLGTLKLHVGTHCTFTRLEGVTTTTLFTNGPPCGLCRCGREDRGSADEWERTQGHRCIHKAKGCCKFQSALAHLCMYI